MPDTKSGREKKGKNKRSQLVRRLYRRELREMERENDEPDQKAETNGEFLADELPDDRRPG